MDPEANAMRNGLVEALLLEVPEPEEGSNAPTKSSLAKQIDNCLQVPCQKVVAKCRGNDGPCKQSAARLLARRECRPLKTELMATHREACSEQVLKLFMAKPKALGTPAAGTLRGNEYEGWVNQCQHAEAEKEDKYSRCFTETLHNTLIDCASDKCLDKARTCAQRSCNLLLPSPPGEE